MAELTGQREELREEEGWRQRVCVEKLHCEGS